MKILKEITKSLYKIIVKYIFFIIYGKIYFKNKRFENVQVINLKHPNVKKNNYSNYKIYVIKNGRLCTDGVEQVAIIDGNQILKDASYTQIKGNLVTSKRNFTVSRGTPYFLKRIKGNVLCLAQGASGNNYFHWMFDIIPKINIIKLGYGLKNIDYFYMPKLQYFQKKILKILKIKKIKFIDSNKYKHIQADNLIVPDHAWYFKGKVFKEANNLPKWIVNWLKNSFINKSKYNSKIKKLFIDRSESKFNHCKLINNNEIIIALKKKGFKIIQVGKLSFERQISLFRNAKVIIGPHGAAFTNLLFCRPKTQIIEIKPKNRPNNYKIISKINNLKYKQFISSSISEKKKINGDMYIDPKKILSELKSE